VKMVSEYLAEVARFERLAAGEKNLTVQAQMLDQAEAYYRLAVRRAKDLNLPPPKRPSAVEDATST
jgi:hypothetical protein